MLMTAERMAAVDTRNHRPAARGMTQEDQPARMEGQHAWWSVAVKTCASNWPRLIGARPPSWPKPRRLRGGFVIGQYGGLLLPDEGDSTPAIGSASSARSFSFASVRHARANCQGRRSSSSRRAPAANALARSQPATWRCPGGRLPSRSSAVKVRRQVCGAGRRPAFAEEGTRERSANYAVRFFSALARRYHSVKPTGAEGWLLTQDRFKLCLLLAAKWKACRRLRKFDVPKYRNLGVGEPAPWFEARASTRDAFALDSVGGRYIVLCFFVGRPRGQSWPSTSPSRTRICLMTSALRSSGSASILPTKPRGESSVAFPAIAFGFRRRHQ